VDIEKYGAQAVIAEIGEDAVLWFYSKGSSDDHEVVAQYKLQILGRLPDEWAALVIPRTQLGSRFTGHIVDKDIAVDPPAVMVHVRQV